MPDKGSETVAPKYALPPWNAILYERGRLVQLGSSVLAQDPYGLHIALGKAFWSSLLPQLSQAITLVGAAVAAFGAAYEARILKKGDPTYELAFTKHYSYALKSLYQHIQTQPHDTLPLVLTCTILAAMEAIRRHQGDALLHAQGAFKLLPRHRGKILNETDECSGTGTGLSDLLAREDDFSLTLCRSMDLVISSYAPGREPVLRQCATSSMRTKISSIEQANTMLAKMLHSCFIFISKATRFKYRPLVELPLDFPNEQGHHVSNLLFWLKNFQENVLESPEFAQKVLNATTRHASILKAQCLIALVHTSTIFMSHEATYDNYTSEFQQIIECAETALDQNELESSAMPPFAPTLGIIMPLCFTAIRCRHPTLRRRAISLLLVADIEGPWNGLIQAAIAAKIVQIEEERPADSGLEPSLLSMPSEISEPNRVCRYAIIDESSGDNNLIHRITVEFSQCSEMDHTMLGEVDRVGKSYWKTWRQDLEIS
jgi:hypothetical protein